MKLLLILSAMLMLMLISACKDAGTDLPPAATVTGVFPDSAAVGDTVLVVGVSFGASRGASTVVVGGASASVIVSWSDTRIIVSVPTGATTGTVGVNVNGQPSNTVGFKVQASVEPRVSFFGQIIPLLTANGCTACHGGTNNLIVTPYASLMLGNSSNGPVVTPYNGEGSVIVRKLRGIAGFGNRMPQGAAPLSDANIELIARWIKQGARNN